MTKPTDGSFYIRLSLMIPASGREAEVVELHRNLVASLAGQPGFIRGFVITGDRWGRVGHMNIYESEAAADHVANTQHVLSVRSQVLLLIDEESHVERSYDVYDPQLASGA